MFCKWIEANKYIIKLEASKQRPVKSTYKVRPAEFGTSKIYAEINPDNDFIKTLKIPVDA